MNKRTSLPLKSRSKLNLFVEDLNALNQIPISPKYKKLAIPEYPFDLQLLSLSFMYRASRKYFYSLGGEFVPKVCSTFRALKAQDLFGYQIEFSPLHSELQWFKDQITEISDPQRHLESLLSFNEISLFHEQNHRILWHLLPPPPEEKDDFCRSLNFAESLVVTLDLALGDELGVKMSDRFERLHSIYRPADEHKSAWRSKSEYRNYLYSLLYVTYLVLQLTDRRDILKATNYVLPGQDRINRRAAKRGLELSELFTLNTNRQWQNRFWRGSLKKWSRLKKDSPEHPFYVAEDPLDFEEEFRVADRVFEHFGL